MNFDKINFTRVTFKNHQKTILCIALCILTIAVYWPVKNYPFINYDDGPYVYNNSRVTSGLSIQNILSAFSLSDSAADKNIAYWLPLALISHMIDVQLFGVDPHMHHVSNLLFHALNTILLFLCFSMMTGDLWKCFFMAALFAIHPINIESTVWIAERKNLLATTFWMAAMLAYIFYVKKPTVYRYLLVVFAMGFGLLTKPMLVVLPCVLLLLDYWPLKRMKWAYGLTIRNHFDTRLYSKTTFPGVSFNKLILEKIPLLLLSFAIIHVSMIIAQQKSQVITTAIRPLSIRVENVFISYVVYLYKMIWPVDLAIFYPFPDSIPVCQTIGAIIFLSLITGFAMIHLRTKPYLIIGWLWFIGVLFPIIGLVQVGQWAALADRFAYVPLIGMYIVIVWGIPDLLSKWHYRKIVLSASAVFLIITLFWGTRTQLSYWTDTYTLFKRSIAVTKNNFLAYGLVGEELMHMGKDKEAKKYLLTALRIKPDHFEAMKNLGELAVQNQNYNIALDYYQKALLFRPSNAKILCIIGDIYLETKKIDKAFTYYSEALGLKPSDAGIYNKIGVIFFKKQMVKKAREKFKTAVRLNPNFDGAYYNLGLVDLKLGKPDEAIMHYKKAIRINPDQAEVHSSLADLLFSEGNFVQALKHYKEALRIDPDDATTHYNIGVILFQQKQFQAADKHFYQALQIDNSYKKAKIALTMTRNSLKTKNTETGN